jgi:hypothetical protein
LYVSATLSILLGRQRENSIWKKAQLGEEVDVLLRWFLKINT